MAHDVWLLRGFVVVCFFLCVLTGVETFPVKTNLHHVWPEVKHEGNLTHEESTAVLPHRESRNKWLTGGHVTLQTKRGDKGRTGKTRTIRSRIQILDKYYVNPDKVKRKVTKESSFKGDNEQSALLLKDPELTAHSNKFMDSALREVPFYADINSVNSVEGSTIVNIASLLEKSRKSQAVKRNNVGRIPASSRYHSLRQESTEHPGWMSMTPSRFRYLNSLIKPQMGEISDDLNDLEALRNHAKDVKARAWSSGLKSFQQKLYGQLWDERSETVKNAKKRAKSNSYTMKEQSDEGASNTETENAAGYRSSDLFLLGNPDDRHYFQSAFMENPMAINLITAGSAQDEPFQNKGSIVRPTTPWKMNGATVPLREEEILGKFQGESETTETASLSSGDDSYSGENSDDLNKKLKTALGLAIQTDIRIKNTTSHALPQPYREKALSHIEEESDDMYNETKGNGSIEDKKVNPFQHFRPTKKRHFTKPTSLITNRRTTIPFPKLGPAHDTSAHGSGGESGSGDHFVSAHEHHQKQVHPHRITKVFLSTKTKQHTGIFGAEDKATITKCEKMGKTDYRERCPHGWLAFDEFCYLFVSKSNGRWEEFPQKCNKENGLLAMPKTDGEVQFLQNKIVSLKHRTKNFYIGLRKKGGIWTWIDDVPYTRDVDVKDELGNKNCAALFEGSINMVSCREPKAGYICEIRKGVRVLPILAFGDSLTNGFHADDLSHTPYGNTLEFLLNKDQHRCYTVTTVAKDGTEAAEMSSRLQDHLKRAKSKYSWIIILAGTNDIAHNSHDRNRRAWDKAAERIINLHITSHRYGAKTVAVTIPEMDCEESKRPPCLHTHLERRYINEKLRYYARSNEFTILCDLADKFPRYSLSSEERKQMWEVGLHMKSAGYERMAEIIYKDLLAHV